METLKPENWKIKAIRCVDCPPNGRPQGRVATRTREIVRHYIKHHPELVRWERGGPLIANREYLTRTEDRESVMGSEKSISLIESLRAR